MQYDRKYARNPSDKKFQRFLRAMRLMNDARAQCFCTACVGSPMGDHNYDKLPCDRGLEIMYEMLVHNQKQNDAKKTAPKTKPKRAAKNKR